MTPTHIALPQLTDSCANAAGASFTHSLASFAYSAAELFGSAHEGFARASSWLWPAAANHLWQSTLFAALVLAFALMLRGAPARVRHALWLVAAAKFALPSALFALAATGVGFDARWLDALAGGAPTGEALVVQLAEPLRAGDDLVVNVSGAAGHAELFCALTLAWAAGAAALALVWAKRRREFLRALGGGREVYAGRAYDALEKARARLGLMKDVLLVVAPGATGPGVWRTRRPLVVLPEEVAERLDEGELESVMTHELAHVERRDNMLDQMQAALSCVLWFHPAVWLIGRRLRAERERACDERVIEAGGEASVYAASILKVVRLCLGPSVAGVSAAAGGHDLRRRIEMIMHGDGRRALCASHRALLCALVIMGFGLTVCAGLVGRGAANAQRGRGGAVVVRTQDGRREPGPAAREIEQSPESGIQFENVAGAPAQINEVRVRQITSEQLRRADEEGADYFYEEERSPTYVTLPTVSLTNVSGKEIKEVGIGYAVSGRVSVITGRALTLRPGESVTISSRWAKMNVIIPADSSDVSARLVWAEFTDGTRWGSHKLTVPAPPPPPRAGDAPSQRGRPAPPASVSDDADAAGGSGSGRGEGSGGGVASGGGEGSGSGSGSGEGSGGGKAVGRGSLNGQKLYAPNPSYPPIAKAARAEGTVSVQVTVDEDGNVVAAKAVSGHPLLQAAAVDAAREAKFKPTYVEGKPVKVSGVITYNFVLAKDKDN